MRGEILERRKRSILAATLDQDLVEQPLDGAVGDDPGHELLAVESLIEAAGQIVFAGIVGIVVDALPVAPRPVARELLFDRVATPPERQVLRAVVLRRDAKQVIGADDAVEGVHERPADGV